MHYVMNGLSIQLYISGVRWHWVVEDLEAGCSDEALIGKGSELDYAEATAAALACYEKARGKR